MVRGLWSAVGGMLTRELKQDVIAHNLANAATAGFKRRTVAFRSTLQTFSAALNEQSGSSVPCASVSIPYVEDYQDRRPGAYKQTGNKMDCAIEGDGSFIVDEAGVQSLTRNGSFVVGPDGELMTTAGETVLGEHGVIKVPEGDCSIDPEGYVIVDQQVVDKLRIVGGGSLDSSARIRQGEIEMSNVNIVTEMVDLISNMRAYEANQHVVRSIDQTLDKLINEAGK